MTMGCHIEPNLQTSMGTEAMNLILETDPLNKPQSMPCAIWQETQLCKFRENMCIRVTWRGILLKHKDPGSVSLGLGPRVCLSVKFPVMSMLMLLVTLGGQLLYAKENYSSCLSVERHWERILFIPCPLFFFLSVYGIYLPGAIYIYPSIS